MFNANFSRTTAKLKQLVNKITEALRGGHQKGREPGFARISLWNGVFPDYPLYVVTDPAQHFVDILRRHHVKAIDASRFCFEMALWMIDQPDLFHSLASVFPAPYTVAMHIAFRLLYEHIEPAIGDSRDLFEQHVREEVPKDQWQHIFDLVKGLSGSMAQVETSIRGFNTALSDTGFDIMLNMLSDPLRVQYALRYGRPCPKVLIDINDLDLPFEFIQAVSDIEGCNVLGKLLDA